MSTPFEGFEHIVRSDELLAAYTSLGIGGPAEYFAEPTNVEELRGVIERASELKLSIKLLGSGSNILIRDEGVAGLVIHLAAPEFSTLEVDGDAIIVGGGCKLAHFITVAAREGFSGPEQLAGIPGTIGGALHHNTDSHGDDIGQWVTNAKVMTRDGKTHDHDANAMNFSYRQSSLTELAILSARFQFKRGASDEISKRLQKQWILRRAGQPTTGERSAYVFKDPGGLNVDNLIEQAGLKGSRMGEVELFTKNASFVVAHQGAVAADVLRLIDMCKSQVSNQLGVELETGIDVW